MNVTAFIFTGFMLVSGFSAPGFNPVWADTTVVTVDTTEVQIPADTTHDVSPRGRERDVAPREPQPRVYPQELPVPVGFNKVFSDSLQRWEQWYNIAERDNSRPGAITYRLGGHGRNDGIKYRATEPRHRRTYFDGILVNDPVTGGMNTNYLPLDRMRTFAEKSDGIYYQSWFELDRFYVTEPLTWINVLNTKHDVRYAEGIFTTNIDRRSNVELAYRGNNDGAEYRRNSMSGRQASVRVNRYFSDNWMMQLMLLYNSFQMNEPEGYEVNDPVFFPFEPDFVSPVSNNSRSSLRNSLITASVYYRPDVSAPVSARMHIYQNRFRRFYYSPDDSTFFRTKEHGLHISNRITAGPFTLEPRLNASYTQVDQELTRSLDKDGWAELRGGARVGVDPVDFVDLTGWASIQYRSDDETGFDAGYRAEISIGNHLQAYQSLSFGILLPTIQQKYWASNEFSGNPDIRPEQIARIEAGIGWGRGWLNELGLRVYGSELTSPIVNDISTGAFINIDTYQTVGGEIYAEVDTKHFEISASSTVQTYLTNSSRPENRQLEDSGIRIWNKISAYYKNYFFDFATYAKIGASVIFSPNPYFTSRYIPVLDYWDPLSDQLEIPGFYRVDLEASARVRNVMFLLKYENILDGVGQNGYFETASYPMPSSRYRVGIRWVLRN